MKGGTEFVDFVLTIKTTAGTPVKPFCDRTGSRMNCDEIRPGSTLGAALKTANALRMNVEKRRAFTNEKPKTVAAPPSPTMRPSISSFPSSIPHVWKSNKRVYKAGTSLFGEFGRRGNLFSRV